MNKLLVKYSFLLLTVLILVSCAQINPLDGGPKDTYAPRIDSAGTYPQNGQTEFSSNEVVIRFSEYISINNPSENIVITPQLERPPTITAKNKKLVIGFNEALNENTTYTISFNHAITDITERNDSVFQFVFSTGKFIDSLQLGGVVNDALTNTGMGSVLVGLYPTNLTDQYDSIPFNNRPLYFAQTGKRGRFHLNYLKAGTYTVFAFQDENRNLKLDPSETRAFMDEETVVISDSTQTIALYAFKPESAEVKIVNSTFAHPGRLQMILSNIPDKFTVSTTQELLKEDTGKEDSVVYWLSSNPTPRMQFYIDLNGELDTIKPLYKNESTLKKGRGLKSEVNLVKGELLPKTKFEINLAEPIDSFNIEGIHLLDIDSTELTPVGIKIENLRNLVFDTLPPAISWIKMDSAAITTIYGNNNQREEWWSIKMLDNSYFGSLTLNIDSVFQRPVVVELLNEAQEIERTVAFQNQLTFIDLIPGKYQVRLIFDDNKDGKWTGGSLHEKRQPEKVLYNTELINVKSKWEKEIDWIIQN